MIVLYSIHVLMFALKFAVEFIKHWICALCMRLEHRLGYNEEERCDRCEKLCTWEPSLDSPKVKLNNKQAKILKLRNNAPLHLVKALSTIVYENTASNDHFYDCFSYEQIVKVNLSNMVCDDDIMHTAWKNASTSNRVVRLKLSRYKQPVFMPSTPKRTSQWKTKL